MGPFIQVCQPTLYCRPETWAYVWMDMISRESPKSRDAIATTRHCVGNEPLRGNPGHENLTWYTIIIIMPPRGGWLSLFLGGTFHNSRQTEKNSRPTHNPNWAWVEPWTTQDLGQTAKRHTGLSIHVWANVEGGELKVVGLLPSEERAYSFESCFGTTAMTPCTEISWIGWWRSLTGTLSARDWSVAEHEWRRQGSGMDGARSVLQHWANP